jgi:hypothetical protein
MSFDSLSAELHLHCFGHLEAADILSVCLTSKRYKQTAIGLLYKDIRVTSWNASRAYKLLQGVEARTDVDKSIKTIEIRHTAQADSWCLPLDQGTNIVMDMLAGILPALHTHTPVPAEIQRAYELWRASFYTIGKVESLLSYLVAIAENLSSLQWLTSGNCQGATPLQLMLAKVRADIASGLQPYRSLRHLQVTAEAEDVRVPLLPDLKRLIVYNAEEDLMFDCTALRGMRDTQLDELGMLRSNNTLRLYEPIRAGLFIQLQVLRIVDTCQDKQMDYSRLPKLFHSKCPRLKTLVWDFQYMDPDEDAIDLSLLPDLSQLKGLTNARLHHQLLVADATTTTFPALYSRLPPGLHHVEITLVMSAVVAADGEEDDEEEDNEEEDDEKEDEDEDEDKGEEVDEDEGEEAACEEEQDGADMGMGGATLASDVVDARPAGLQSMRLVFDFDVSSHTSLAPILALAHPVLSALVESAERQDFSLGIYVRRIGDPHAEDKFYLGCETEMI